MSGSLPSVPAEPLLRTLSPLLSDLERSLERWLERTHAFPLSMVARANLEGILGDLTRQAEALSQDKPTLLIMLMGGTGVGKSTLLNALAGSSIAQASFTRPTTRDPVVYYHQSLRPDSFDPMLRHCRLVQHDRAHLTQKIIVDTPDLDSNDLANRDKLAALLPLADIVLYVGSQEKYHDRLGWELFKQHRQRRAFAFVLNKWDRCSQTAAAGVQPDADLLRDLQAEGFAEPLLFRTVAQAWLDFQTESQSETSRDVGPPGLPAGEQFRELRDWLELGLSRLEIEAVKARGVGQLLLQLRQGLDGVCPPDLDAVAKEVQHRWEALVDDEAAVDSDVLISTLEPYQQEVEHHFSLETQQRFQNLMAGYLKLMNKLRYAGSSLRNRVPLGMARERTSSEATSGTWNLSSFLRECSRVAGERSLDRRSEALINRLLVDADEAGFPLALITPYTRDAGKLDWHERYDRALMDALQTIETQFLRPTGGRMLLEQSLVFLANVVPGLVLLGALVLLLWRYTVLEGYSWQLFDVLLPFLLTLVVLIIFHILIVIFLPLRWAAIRAEFHHELTEGLKREFRAVYAAIPGDVALAMHEERQVHRELVNKVEEVRSWLAAREQQANIAGLYANR